MAADQEVKVKSRDFPQTLLRSGAAGKLSLLVLTVTADPRVRGERGKLPVLQRHLKASCGQTGFGGEENEETGTQTVPVHQTNWFSHKSETKKKCV